MGSDTFVGFVLGQLSDVQGLGCRAMFGGHGLYVASTFFGIVYDGRLYFKTDDSTEPGYTRRGMRPFRPNDRQLLKTYYEVPTDVLENREELSRWVDAAARAAGSDAALSGGRRDSRPKHAAPSRPGGR